MAAPKVIQHLPDFQDYKDAKRKKEAFFNYMAILDQQVNDVVLADRQKVLYLFALTSLTSNQQRWLNQIAIEYDLTKWNPRSLYERKALLARVDIVPTPLLLAQAANESGWGSSRFAAEGNNLFGIWCFTKGCGLIPKRRNVGASHEVMVFPTPLDAVKYYVDTLNTNNNYRTFRKLRAEMREKDEPLDSKKLIEGLHAYSARGKEYIRIIRSIITYNDLEKKYP